MDIPPFLNGHWNGNLIYTWMIHGWFSSFLDGFSTEAMDFAPNECSETSGWNWGASIFTSSVSKYESVCFFRCPTGLKEFYKSLHRWVGNLGEVFFFRTCSFWLEYPRCTSAGNVGGSIIFLEGCCFPLFHASLGYTQKLYLPNLFFKLVLVLGGFLNHQTAVYQTAVAPRFSHQIAGSELDHPDRSR